MYKLTFFSGSDTNVLGKLRKTKSSSRCKFNCNSLTTSKSVMKSWHRNFECFYGSVYIENGCAIFAIFVFIQYVMHGVSGMLVLLEESMKDRYLMRFL